MKKTRFTESQITGALKYHETGKTILDICGLVLISTDLFVTCFSESTILKIPQNLARTWQEIGARLKGRLSGSVSVRVSFEKTERECNVHA
jgi:hypothetical protein